MVSITLAVPEELKQEMDKYPDINWSAVAREAIHNRITMMEKFRQFSRDSKMTEEDALRLGKKVNKSLAKRYNL